MWEGGEHLPVNLLFAVALSLDGLGMGLSYGVRRIKIPLVPLFIICLASGLAIFLSMLAGEILEAFLSARVSLVLGAVLLMLMGLWIILQNFFLITVGPSLYRSKLPHVGLVVRILKEPVLADLNWSGEIDTHEAVFLGVALAMDALGAGFGAALAGYSLFWTPLLVALVEFLMINFGLWIGKILDFGRQERVLKVVPGAMIICLGLFKLVGGY